jgi:glycosyltransferase involved in cell wall biosynthesis
LNVPAFSQKDFEMAKLALVQSYPYDEIVGGDGAYIVALARYLREHGHEVHGLVTDTVRGRASPVYKSAYRVGQFESWRVRGALKLGRETFFRPHRAQAARILRKLARLAPRANQPPPFLETWVEREADWARRQIGVLRPDATILVHDAVHFAPFLKGIGAIFALLGHVPAYRPLASAAPARQEAVSDIRLVSDYKRRLSASLAHVDCVGLNNRDDIAYVRRELGISSVTFVGMGFARFRAHAESEEPVVLFVGANTDMNIASLAWFTGAVWPAVLAHCPKARFRIVGRSATALSGDLDPSIERVGPVADLDAEYARAQLVVAPLVSGTAGVKIKVAEALSHGRPVVTTTIGVDGRDPHQLNDAAYVADSAQEFALATIALLENAGLRKAKADGARRVFERLFSCEACYGEFMFWLKGIEGRAKANRARDDAGASQRQEA